MSEPGIAILFEDPIHNSLRNKVIGTDKAMKPAHLLNLLSYGWAESIKE